MEAEAEEKQSSEQSDTDTAPSNRSVEEIRGQIGRYDVMRTQETQPELTAQPTLARLLAALLGIVAIGIGGYLSTKP